MTIFFKKKKELSQTFQKMLPKKKMQKITKKISECNCRTKQQQHKSVMREVGRDNCPLIISPLCLKKGLQWQLIVEKSNK